MSSTIVILEVFWFCLGGAIFAYRPSRRVSEALSLGIVIALMLLSIIFQVSFLLELPSFSFFLEVLVPPANYDSMTYNLSRVFLFQQENSLFLKSVNTPRQALMVMGSDILSYAFLRFYSDYGVGIFSFLAYISVGVGTYALSRNFAPVKISIASTLVIVSLPEFCFQATATKNDIFTAASAVFCFLTAYRVLESLNIEDFSLTILGLSFGFSAKTTFLAFLVPFTITFGFLPAEFYRSETLGCTTL